MATPVASYRFGPFVVDQAGYRLLNGAVPIPMSPKALDLLLLFVGRPQTLVTKDDLLKALWPDVAVTDNALTQVVSELRQALEDDAAAPRFVETVPRKGYRFIAPVESLATSPDPPPVPAHAQDRAPEPASRPRTIGVKSFTNLTGDPGVAWLAAGIAETVTNDLRAIPDLRVIDRNLIAEAARRQPTEGGRHDLTGLDLVVVGSYQRAGDRLRITARAIEVRSGETLAQAKSDGLLADVFQLQDSLVTQLSAGLDLTLTPAAAARIHVRETSNLEAYRAFTEGRLKLETLDPAQVAPAMADFDRALGLDPRYALAHVGLAHAHFWIFQATRARNRIDVASLTKAVAHARRAVELDEGLAEAHSALAFFLVSADRPVEAIAAGRRALALEPGNWRHQFRLGVAAWGNERLACLDAVIAQFPQMAYAHFGIAMVHVARGDLGPAEETLARGLAFDEDASAGVERFPGKGLHWLFGLTRLSVGDVAAARAAFDRELSSKRRGLFAEEFAMDSFDGHGFALLEAGDPREAALMFGKALERFPDHARSLLGQAEAFRRSDLKREAEAAVAHAVRAIGELRDNGRHTEAAMSSAIRLALGGQSAQAIAALDDLLRKAAPGFAGWTIPVEPALASLKPLPAFTSVLGRLADRAR
jgi:DNA-binding winged helix-turn-helix (wHTH) protein/tetratricopeptide (TPR) repeat protein